MKAGNFLILAAAFFFLCSCSPMNSRSSFLQTAIVGKWKEINGPGNIRFFKDAPSTIQFYKEGTVIIMGKKSSLTAWYEFLDEEQLRIEPKFGPGDTKGLGIIVKASIVEDYLTLTDPNGHATSRFQREEKR